MPVTISIFPDIGTLARIALLALPLLVTIATDLRRREVYPGVLLVGCVAAVVTAAYGPLGVTASLLSGLCAGAVMAILALLARWLWPHTDGPPLGDGDILIAVTAGVMLGPERTAPALIAGMVLAAVAAAVLLLSGRANREAALPYGAFLCLTTVIALGT